MELLRLTYCPHSFRIVRLTRSDSFANVVDLLDDMFERAAHADEPLEMNFIKKHAVELAESGVTERTAARLFSNPYVINGPVCPWVGSHWRQPLLTSAFVFGRFAVPETSAVW